jgi:hypothetical protein
MRSASVTVWKLCTHYWLQDHSKFFLVSESLISKYTNAIKLLGEIKPKLSLKYEFLELSSMNLSNLSSAIDILQYAMIQDFYSINAIPNPFRLKCFLYSWYLICLQLQ